MALMELHLKKYLSAKNVHDPCPTWGKKGIYDVLNHDVIYIYVYC